MRSRDHLGKKKKCTCACSARAPDAPPAAADAPSPGLAASLVAADTLRTTVSLRVHMNVTISIKFQAFLGAP